MNNLPVLYYANRNARITTEIFLVLDNCAAHSHLDYFEQVNAWTDLLQAV
jgi:hypothetical protein